MVSYQLLLSTHPSKIFFFTSQFIHEILLCFSNNVSFYFFIVVSRPCTTDKDCPKVEYAYKLRCRKNRCVHIPR